MKLLPVTIADSSAERVARRQFSGAQTLGSVKISVQALPIVI
jgi:hypothetical protein